ncbi:FAD-binding domain-containing protein [Nemania sp. FL0916]|nr:FAD-binding domain-containing protein [Nemania sp. FL0916]
MDHLLDAFCASINLSSPRAWAFKSKYNEAHRRGGFTATAVLDLACLAAQLSFSGRDDRGDVSPLTRTPSEGQDNWSRTCAAAKPYCVFEPADAADVSKALEIVRFFQTRFAVRSGGYSPNPGHANVDGGVLIDLHKLDGIDLSDDGTVARIGPGARWGDVYAALDPYEVSVIGARVPDVGVGGSVLGGGMFHFSGEFGLAADNVKNFEIVLADGTITNANATENADLFWALKGGGPNFGIVTRYDLYTVPVRDIWYRVDAYPVDEAEAILDAMARWQLEGAADLKATVALVLSLDSVVVGLLYSAPADQPSAFAPFYEFQPLVTLVPPTNGTVTTLTDFIGKMFTYEPKRHDTRSASSRIDAQLYKDVWRVWKARAREVRETTGAHQTFTIQPVPRTVKEQGLKHGGNPMGIPLEDHQWWTTVIDWRDAKDDDLVRSIAIETCDAWKTLGQERGSYLPYIFMNDSSRDQNPLAAYGPENLAKLRHIALKYDPEQLFQRLQNGGFLLSKA